MIEMTFGQLCGLLESLEDFIEENDLTSESRIRLLNSNPLTGQIDFAIKL